MHVVRVVRRSDNRWTTRVTDGLLRGGSKSKGRQLTRWRDEIRTFGGERSGPGQHKTGIVGGLWERPSSCRGHSLADDDDDAGIAVLCAQEARATCISMIVARVCGGCSCTSIEEMVPLPALPNVHVA